MSIIEMILTMAIPCALVVIIIMIGHSKSKDPSKDEKYNPYVKKAKIIGYTQSTTDQLPKRPKPKYEYRPDYTYSS